MGNETSLHHKITIVILPFFSPLFSSLYVKYIYSIQAASISCPPFPTLLVKETMSRRSSGKEKTNRQLSFFSLPPSFLPSLLFFPRPPSILCKINSALSFSFWTSGPSAHLPTITKYRRKRERRMRAVVSIYIFFLVCDMCYHIARNAAFSPLPTPSVSPSIRPHARTHARTHSSDLILILFLIIPV